MMKKWLLVKYRAISRLEYTNHTLFMTKMAEISLNRSYSYSRYWAGTNLQWRLMRGNSIKNRLMSFAFEKVPPQKPHLQASSSQIPGIRIWPIDTLFMSKTAEKPYLLGPHIPIQPI